MEPLQTLIDLASRPEFLAGLAAGGGVFLFLFLIHAEERTPGLGLLLSGSVLMVLYFYNWVGSTVLVGLAVLAVGGLLLNNVRLLVRTSGWVLIAGGALATGGAGGPLQVAWVGFAAPIVIVAIGLALSRWVDGGPSQVVGPLITLTAFGIWATLPDTEAARVLLGSSLALAISSFPPVRSALTSSGSFALAGILVWIAMVGGNPRPSSILGAWASIGVLALLPALNSGTAIRVPRPVILVAVHAVLVVLASRVFGLWDSPILTLVGLVAVAIFAYVSLAVMWRPQPEAH